MNALLSVNFKKTKQKKTYKLYSIRICCITSLKKQHTLLLISRFFFWLKDWTKRVMYSSWGPNKLTSLIVALCQNLNIAFEISRCLNGIFPWRNRSSLTLLFLNGDLTSYTCKWLGPLGFLKIKNHLIIESKHVDINFFLNNFLRNLLWFIWKMKQKIIVHLDPPLQLLGKKELM